MPPLYPLSRRPREIAAFYFHFKIRKKESRHSAAAPSHPGSGDAAVQQLDKDRRNTHRNMLAGCLTHADRLTHCRAQRIRQIKSWFTLAGIIRSIGGQCPRKRQKLLTNLASRGFWAAGGDATVLLTMVRQRTGGAGAGTARPSGRRLPRNGMLHCSKFEQRAIIAGQPARALAGLDVERKTRRLPDEEKKSRFGDRRRMRRSSP